MKYFLVELFDNKTQEPFMYQVKAPNERTAMECATEAHESNKHSLYDIELRTLKAEEVEENVFGAENVYEWQEKKSDEKLFLEKETLGDFPLTVETFLQEDDLQEDEFYLAG